MRDMKADLLAICKELETSKDGNDIALSANIHAALASWTARLAIQHMIAQKPIVDNIGAVILKAKQKKDAENN